MVLNCQVRLDNPKSIYEPGDRITGHVILTLEVRLLIKAVAITYTGFAEVKWENVLPPKKVRQTKHKKGSEPPSTVEPHVEQCIEVYNNREDFLSNVNYCVGSEDAIARIIERGIYTYPFTVTLPQSCPSTFESANGHIRYMLEVFVDHKNKREVWYTQKLQVLKPFDLRQCKQIAEQVRDVHVEEVMPLRFFKHPLKMCVNLQQFGFVPGEPLSIHVSIQNIDNLRLHELIYELQQISRITASHGHNKTKTKWFHTILAKAVHKICGPQEECVQHLQELYMPQAVPSTDPADCHCLQISYELRVLLSTRNAKRSVQAKIPIIVGTVSLRSAVEALALPSTLQSGAFAACSVENLSSKVSESNLDSIVEVPDNFALATAPELEFPVLNVHSLNLSSSSFRKATHLPKTKFDAAHKKSKYQQEQTDFQPTYLYYDMDSRPGVQNVAPNATTTTANTIKMSNATQPAQQNNSESQNSESIAYAGVVQQLRSMQKLKGIMHDSS